MPDIERSSDDLPARLRRAGGTTALEAADEVERLRALLKQAHDRDKWLGEFPTIKWYDEVARYFKGQVADA